MASVKITELASSGPLTGSEVLPIVQGNETVKVTVQEIANLAGLAGTQYIYVAANGTDIENAAELQAAYTKAQMMLPTSNKRVTIIAAPGNYNFETTTFLMDTDFLDLVSLDGNRSIVFNSSNNSGGIHITANNVYVKGVDTLSKTFEVNSNLNLIKVENCKGGNNSLGLNSGFILSGTFIDCEMGDNSFAAAATTLSGTFINCIAGSNSFGRSSSTLSGIFTNCKAGNNSFGTTYATVSGTFNNCIGGDNSFGTVSATVSGTFNNCIGGDNSFGGSSNITGTFINCVGGPYSFGGDLMGTLSAKLFYCRLTNNGTFKTVGIGGLTIYCIDGNNNPNNQGFISQNNL